MAIFVYCNNCEQTYEVESHPPTCPDCFTEKPLYESSPSYLTLQERLYGTSYGSGRYNEGLGVKTYGKQDWRRKAAQLGLRHKEPGEPKVNSRQEAARRARTERQQVIAEKLKGL